MVKWEEGASLNSEGKEGLFGDGLGIDGFNGIWVWIWRGKSMEPGPRTGPCTALRMEAEEHKQQKQPREGGGELQRSQRNVMERTLREK